MNEYTLITLVGTGMYKKQGGYQKTTYIFEDNRQYETKLFYEAILKSNYKPIKKLIFVGTYTSAWDKLIDENSDEQLWTNVYAQVDSTGVYADSDLVPLIQEHLKKRFSVEVEIFIHTNKIDFDTTENIFNVYSSIIPFIEKDNNILFDITHGFRSMPILMYQALQFASSGKDNLKNVEIIYGEFIPNSTNSYVRNLSNYWHYARITEAISIFKSKLDGSILAPLLEKQYESYSKVIKSISNMVHTNFSLQIIEVLKQIKNVLKEAYDIPPFWFSEINSFLEHFYKKIYSNKSDSRILYNYANYLYENKLNTQAIISLQLAVETACAEKSDKPKENKGNYNYWQNQGKYLKKRKLSGQSEIQYHLHILEVYRNQIAHGGARDKNTEAFPSADGVTKNFRSLADHVNKFLLLLDL